MQRFLSSFQGVGIVYRCSHFSESSSTVYRGVLISVYRGVLISGSWNREVLLYTEVSSFEGVGIERFHCIQRCPYFWGLK